MLETVLEIRNINPNEAVMIDLRFLELTQGLNGTLQIIEPDSNVDTTGLTSCLKWIKLSTDSVEVKPLQMAPVTGRICG